MIFAIGQIFIAVNGQIVKKYSTHVVTLLNGSYPVGPEQNRLKFIKVVRKWFH